MRTTRAWMRLLEREREAFAAERKLLIDQICHLSRQPWTPAPSHMQDVYERDEEEEPQYVHTDHWPE